MTLSAIADSATSATGEPGFTTAERNHAINTEAAHPCERVARMPFNQLLYHAFFGLLSGEDSQPA